jgi:hypothetical protein
MSFLAKVTAARTTGYDETFTSSFNTFSDDVTKVVTDLKNKKEKIVSLLSDIADLAGFVYEEGDDYYGDDYISQILDQKWKTFITDIDEDFWELPKFFQNLINELERIFTTLKQDAKTVSEQNPELRAQIERLFGNL